MTIKDAAREFAHRKSRGWQKYNETGEPWSRKRVNEMLEYWMRISFKYGALWERRRAKREAE